VQEDDLEMIEGFYNQQLEMAHKRLYELIQQLIQLVRQIISSNVRLLAVDAR
jgi:hypothetical protein